MIRIDYGIDDHRNIVFRWSCEVCNVDDQALEPDEGIDSVGFHLQRFHKHDELVRFGTILTKGMAASAKLANPDQDNGDQIDRIADKMAEYITTGFERSPA